MNFSSIDWHELRDTTSPAPGFNHNLQTESATSAEFEKAIAEQLAMPPTDCRWRQSEMEQAGCREGIRLAALEFYWEHREEIRLATLAQTRLT